MNSSPDGTSKLAKEPHEFAGFPASAQATAIPSLFFSEVLPQIEDEIELRVTLYVFYALGRRKGYPLFLTERELRSEAPLLATLGDGSEAEPLSKLASGLDLATKRGTILRLDLVAEGQPEVLYTTNNPANRRAFDQVREGSLALGRALPPESGAASSRRDNVFQLYEQNIGPITPLVAEELREAEHLYPYEWLEEALREAALLNKRSWRYASRILQRWATEGRTNEKTERDSAGDDSARSQILSRYRQRGS